MEISNTIKIRMLFRFKESLTESKINLKVMGEALRNLTSSKGQDLISQESDPENFLRYCK